MKYPAKLAKPYKVYLCGSEGCGKGHKSKIITKPETRLVVFDAPYDWEPARTKIQGDLKKLRLALIRPHFRIAFRPDLYDLEDQFTAFCKAVFAVGRCMVVIDEMNMVTTATSTPKALLNLTSRSRHRGIKMIGMSQRPAETGKSFISNATEIYAGNLAEPADLQPLRVRAGAEFVEGLPQLPLRKLKHWKRPE